MKLRTRLIVAFLLLSVVPLVAVTTWSYTSNVKALQEAASREADLLAGELNQRMQLVTAQLGERVAHLMDMPVSSSSPVVRVSQTKPVAPSPAVVDETPLGDQVANALGEAAILLNNVEVPTTPSGRLAQPPAHAAPAGQAPIPPESPDSSHPSGGTHPKMPRVRPLPTRQASGMGRAGTPLPAPPTPGAAGAAPPGPTDPSRIRIDLSAIWRDLYKQVVPEGQKGDLTSAQRQLLVRDISQRVLGIKGGSKQRAAVLQKKAEAVRQEADARATAATATQSAAASPPDGGKPVSPAAPPDGRPAAMTKKSALSGNRLDVTMEQNGQVVSNVNAEVNLPNLLMTVFSAVGREQGEVPFAVGTDGRVYTPTDEDRARVEKLGAVARPDGPLGRTVLPEWVVVTTADPSGSGLRFGIARPVGDSLSSLRRTASLNAGLGLAFIGLAIVGIVPLSSRLTRNLSTLTDGVKRIAHGDYAARVRVKTHDEIGDLARAFNQMAEDVEKHQRAIVGQERLKRELELGRQIQHDMLPRQPLRLGSTEIQGVSVPAREVGGDFFNYFVRPNGHVALLIGDVSGKGVGAALLMANIQASLRTRFALGQDLSAIAHEIDEEIAANSPGPMYATLFVGIVDPVTRELRYVSAGHHPQFVLHPQGGLESMSATGLPVGLLAGRGYTEQSVQLAPGDLVFCYTDGCVETENESGDMFGAERLEELLVSTGAASVTDVLRRLQRAMEQFRGSRELYDDVTMMAVRIG